MNTKDFLRLGVPLGEATRPPSLPSALRFDAASRYGATRRTMDFVAHFILGSGDNSRLHYGNDRQPV
jgi:hypothetical protein